MKKPVRIMRQSLIDVCPIDYAYKAYLKEGGAPVRGAPMVPGSKFEDWLWKNYQAVWDTGQMFDKDDLVFHSEPHMTMFLLKFGANE